MGEDLARDRTRLRRRRWALTLAIVVAGVAGGLGGSWAADARDVGVGEAPAPARIASLRGSAPALEPHSPVATPPATAVGAPAVGASVVSTTVVTATVVSTTVVSTTVVPEPAPVVLTPVAPIEAAHPTAPALVEPNRAPAEPVDGTALAGWTRRSDLEAELVARHNVARAEVGLAPYAEGSCLTSVAVGWARTMAERSVLAHNPAYADQIVACSRPALVGENVGVGYEEAGGVTGVFDTFMASATHRANIVDPDFNRMGVGVWSSSDGTIRVAVNFAVD